MTSNTAAFNMLPDVVYEGDTGTEILVDVKQDITAALSQTLEVHKPGGEVLHIAATIVEATKVRALCDFDVQGTWKMQPRVVMPTGAWRGITFGVGVRRLFT